MRAALVAGYVIWLRDIIRFLRDWPRLIGALGQPLMYLFILGDGLGSAFRLIQVPQGYSYVSFLYPGIIGMSVLFTSLFSGISIIQDREYGFLKEILVAPVPRWALLLGKAAGGASTAVLQGAILILLAPFAGVHLTVGAVCGMLGIMALLALSLTSFALAVASRMESLQGFQMIMNFLVMPMYFLSGAMFPLTGTVGWLGFLMRLDPLLYGVNAFRALLHPLGVTVASSIRFSTDLTVVAVFGVVTLMLGTLSFARRA